MGSPSVGSGSQPEEKMNEERPGAGLTPLVGQRREYRAKPTAEGDLDSSAPYMPMEIEYQPSDNRALIYEACSRVQVRTNSKERIWTVVQTTANCLAAWLTGGRGQCCVCRPWRTKRCAASVKHTAATSVATSDNSGALSTTLSQVSDLVFGQEWVISK